MDNIYAIILAALRGLGDSLKGTITLFYLDKNIKERALRTSPVKDHNTPSRRKESNRESHKSSKKEEEPKVLRRTLECCALNGGVFWFSMYVFESGLLPLLKYLLTLLFGQSSSTGKSLWSWMKLFLSCTFGAFWVLPLFLLSKIVNSLWFQDIADSAYRYSRGRPQLLSSVSKLIADTLFSVLVQALFLVQSTLVSMLPIVFLGDILCLVHMCMLYSLYAFEYKWFNMGWELHRRLTFIESNWPYFIGFGLPLAVLTAIPNSFFNSGCVFSILFPLFIISGNEADPVTGVCDYPLQLFSPVIAISNALFNRTIRPRTIEASNVRR
ncbi:etoposide-induced protein 2.4 homolog isoform X2 [Periplaneta americana]|uniref:etoposide-induced protein 2.4 homolog isoform X2 n=1 Tax=Periplaneta americana TaxID=6978 RepID=UPI0037E74676